MGLIVTIEKQKDGTYIAYNTNDNKVAIIGTGDSVNEAKADFFNSVKETIEACKEAGLQPTISLEEESDYRFDVSSLFEYYKLINVTAFAECLGINASLLRQYKAGNVYISDVQFKKNRRGDSFNRARIFPVETRLTHAQNRVKECLFCWALLLIIFQCYFPFSLSSIFAFR